MEQFVIAPIVEGHGEVPSMPILLRRIVKMVSRIPTPIRITPPQRVPKGRMLKADAMLQPLNTAAAQIQNEGIILITLDADNDMTCVLGPQILSMARELRADKEILVSVLDREFESIFIAGALSLGAPEGAVYNRRNPKSEVARIIGRKYTETVDQAQLSEIVDLTQARSLPSFERLCRKLESLLTAPPGP